MGGNSELVTIRCVEYLFTSDDCRTYFYHTPLSSKTTLWSYCHSVTPMLWNDHWPFHYHHNGSTSFRKWMLFAGWHFNMLDFLNGSISNFMQIEHILYVWAGCEYIYRYIIQWIFRPCNVNLKSVKSTAINQEYDFIWFYMVTIHSSPLVIKCYKNRLCKYSNTFNMASAGW